MWFVKKIVNVAQLNIVFEGRGKRAHLSMEGRGLPWVSFLRYLPTHIFFKQGLSLSGGSLNKLNCVASKLQMSPCLFFPYIVALKMFFYHAQFLNVGS